MNIETIQTKRTSTHKTVVKRVLNFIALDVTQFTKTTQILLAKKLTIAHGSGIYTILSINFKLAINTLNNKF